MKDHEANKCSSKTVSQSSDEIVTHKCKLCSCIKDSTVDMTKHCFLEHNYCVECEQKFDSLIDAIQHMNAIHSTSAGGKTQPIKETSIENLSYNCKFCDCQKNSTIDM